MMLVLGFAALALVAVGGRQGFVLLRGMWSDHNQATRRAWELANRTLDDESASAYAERTLESRKLDLEERRLGLLERQARGPATPQGIPSDLFRRIMKWGNQDAQEAERKVVLDLYQEFQDAPDPWAEVRAHLPIEPTDTVSDDFYAGGLVS